MLARLSRAQREKFLRGRRIALLATNGADDVPVPSPIWYLFRDGLFYFRTAANAVKTQNIQRDGRVSVCVQDERAPYKAVIPYGTAKVDDSAGWLAKEMPRHYLGFVGATGYQSAEANIETGPEITLVVRLERFSSFDFSAETPWYGTVWLLAKRLLPPWV